MIGYDDSMDPCPLCGGDHKIGDHPTPLAGQVWEDRGTQATVEKVMPDGGAIVRVYGLRHPVQASYFQRARLVSEPPSDSEYIEELLDDDPDLAPAIERALSNVDPSERGSE